MKITKQEVVRKGKTAYIYKYLDGRFASKQLFEEQEKMEQKPKKNKRKKKVTSKEQEVVMKDNFLELAPVIEEIQLNSQFIETINIIEEKIDFLDKSEEWAGESGIYDKGIEPYKVQEESQKGAFDEFYKQGVLNFEKSIEEEIEKPVIGLTIGEEKLPDTHVQPKEKSRGFFSTWFKKWIW